MRQTRCKTKPGWSDRGRARRMSMTFVAFWIASASAVAIGCAAPTQVILRPDPYPVASDMALVQFDDLVKNGALKTGDPFMEYLYEVAVYFEYIDVLRGEVKPIEEPAPWWKFWQ